jgi:endonuclease/exonuclease/phosphatase family metal-dependent hydrolase
MNFSVMTLNLRFGLADDGLNGWGFRKKAFPSFFEKHRADFMAFQEVNDFQGDHLRTLLPNHHCTGQRKPAPRYWQNNLIFYNKEWECLHSDHFFLSHTPDVRSQFEKSRWPRQCTIGQFRKGKYRLICVSTHFDFDEEVQAESARVILNRLEQQEEEVSVIVAGDFNSQPGSSAHQVFTGSRAGEGGGFMNAFSEYPSTHHGFTGKGIGGHIDWILYRGAVKPLDTKVIQQPFDGIYISDHFPVRAAFCFQE